MFIKFVYDLTGAFGIVGGNHLGTVGIIEKEHVMKPDTARKGQTEAWHFSLS